MINVMQPNPYETPKHETAPLLNSATVFWSWPRFVFLLTAFFAAILSFYCGLAITAYSTPFFEPEIGITMLAGFLDWAFGFAVVCTVVVGVLSLFARQVEAWHYLLLLILFVIEFSISSYFFSWHFSASHAIQPFA